MFEYLLSWAITVIPMMYSPGPANVLMASSGHAFGLRGSLRLILGILAGLFLILIAIVLGANQFLVDHPQVFKFIQYAGVGYIFYMAIQFFRVPADSGSQEKKLKHQRGFIDGLLFEILNPKALMVFGLLVPLFMQKCSDCYHMVALIITTIILQAIGCVIWTCIGKSMRKVTCGRAQKLQSHFFGIMLFGVAVWMLLQKVSL